jgi:hypothetical protein
VHRARAVDDPGSVRSLPSRATGCCRVILSKAFMLADDHRITDPSILARIN